MTAQTEHEIQRTLGKIEGKLDELLRRANGHDAAGAGLTARVTELEGWRSWISGGLAVVGVLAGAALSVAIKVLLRG